MKWKYQPTRLSERTQHENCKNSQQCYVRRLSRILLEYTGLDNCLTWTRSSEREYAARLRCVSYDEPDHSRHIAFRPAGLSLV